MQRTSTDVPSAKKIGETPGPNVGPMVVAAVPDRRVDGSRPSISVVIPALNEARNLPHVAARMPSDVDEIVLVAGHSTDDTVAVAREIWPNVNVVFQNRRGKGNALACGFAASTGTIVVMMDADGSTDPAEIPKFVAALVNGADYAKGTRFHSGGGSADITRFRRLGNLFLNSLVNTLFRTRYSDLCYGYNAVWRRNLDSLGLEIGTSTAAQWGDGFEIETIMNVRAALLGMEIMEVGSFEHDRIHGASNLSAWRDGLRVLRTIQIEHNRYRSGRSVRPAIFATARKSASDGVLQRSCILEDPLELYE